MELTKEQKIQMYRAKCISSINKTEGWQILLDMIDEIKKEDFDKYLKMSSQDLTTRKGLYIKGRQKSFEKLFHKLEDLEVILKRTSRQE